jgi:hypothetical protein
MINPGFKISANDVVKLDRFKLSAAYGTYLNAISKSPVYKKIMEKHLDDVDISSDLEVLKHKGKLPSGIDSKALNTLFKQSISRMAINMVADTIIMKEIEDNAAEDVIKSLKQDADLLYLLGLANIKYYVEAKKQIEDGKVKDDSLIYRGYIAWLKNHTEEELGEHIEKTMNKTAPNNILEEKPSEASKEMLKLVDDLSDVNVE